MNKLTLLGLIPLVMGGVVVATPSPKVTICHATSSETNPWTRIVVSENAISGHFDNPGTPKAGHEDDILLQGEQDCPAPEEPETPPTDTPEEPKATPEVPVSTPESTVELTPMEGK